MNSPFPRAAGILLPVSSLPSPYGIGSLGREAEKFLQFLSDAGQTYWQMLPVGPTGYGDSPYQSFSAFAGNPYFIDLDRLHETGMLQPDELSGCGASTDEVPYGTLFATRFRILEKAFRRFDFRQPHFVEFCEKQSFWLEDYALFMAIKQSEQQHDWQQWPWELKSHQPDALSVFQKNHPAEVLFWKFCQYVFFEQWHMLHQQAQKLKIRLIGDIPIYVSPDSADVWAHAEQFQLDENRRFIDVAGVPPDGFSPTGQHWGNPLYRWDVMEQDGFAWWRRRIAACAALFDAIRIDHFIGICRYYAIPADCPTAIDGEWRPGPGKKLTDAIEEAAGDTQIIAEDLGVLHESVVKLLHDTQYPGMKILEFADDSKDNPHVPYRYTPNSVAYVGTHDNETAAGFCTERTADQLRFLRDYLHVSEQKSLPDAMIRCVLASGSNTAIISMQDWLGLDNHARINTPSTLGGNWIWRLLTDQITPELTAKIRSLTRLYGR